jgi:phosphatidylglycerol---prolipoprotein diacylglyceryl transferase
MNQSIYGLLVATALITSLYFWHRRFKSDSRFFYIFLGAICGAFMGAKIAFFISEGWNDWGSRDFYWKLFIGKSILGALPGGYLGVETVKKYCRISDVTGDSFASFVPISVALGRIGCWNQKCCQGIWMGNNPGWQWPSVAVELFFNINLAFLFWYWRRKKILVGQHFHVYLMAYGLFRFFHEFLRATVKLDSGFSIYQLLALLLFGFGLWMFLERRRGRLVQSAGKVMPATP